MTCTKYHSESVSSLNLIVIHIWPNVMIVSTMKERWLFFSLKYKFCNIKPLTSGFAHCPFSLSAGVYNAILYHTRRCVIHVIKLWVLHRGRVTRGCARDQWGSYWLRWSSACWNGGSTNEWCLLTALLLLQNIKYFYCKSPFTNGSYEEVKYGIKITC